MINNILFYLRILIIVLISTLLFKIGFKDFWESSLLNFDDDAFKILTFILFIFLLLSLFFDVKKFKINFKYYIPSFIVLICLTIVLTHYFIRLKNYKSKTINLLELRSENIVARFEFKENNLLKINSKHEFGQTEYFGKYELQDKTMTLYFEDNDSVLKDEILKNKNFGLIEYPIKKVVLEKY